MENAVSGAISNLEDLIQNMINEGEHGVTLQMFLSDGMYLDNTLTSTTASVRVYRRGVDITDSIDASQFNWTRKSFQEGSDDTTWNEQHRGMKSIEISEDDVDFHAVFACVLTYGAMDISFSCEDGDLYQTTSELYYGGKFDMADGDLYVTPARNETYSIDGNCLVVDNPETIYSVRVETTIVDRTDDPYTEGINASLLSQSSAITQLSNQIEFRVTEVALDEKLAGAISALNSTVTQTAEDLTIQFSQQMLDATNPLQSAINTLQTYIRTSIDGLEIGKLDSPFTTRLDNTRLSFMQNGAEVAYISNNRLYIVEAQVRDRLSIGNEENGLFEWVTTQYGLGLRWRG